MLDLTKEVNKILREYVDHVEGAVLDAEEKTGKEAVKKLKQTSPENPKGKGKHYKSDWTINQKAKKNYSQIIIHNRQAQLTHLLEHGHDIVRNGVKVGHWEPRTAHIKPVEEWVQDTVVERIEREL